MPTACSAVPPAAPIFFSQSAGGRILAGSRCSLCRSTSWNSSSREGTRGGSMPSSGPRSRTCSRTGSRMAVGMPKPSRAEAPSSTTQTCEYRARMRPCSSQRTPVPSPPASSARNTASRFLSRQRGGSLPGNSPTRTACTLASAADRSPRASTRTRCTSSPGSSARSSKVAALPKGLSAGLSFRRSTTRLCSGCTNHTEAPTETPPSVTSMSPSGCGTVLRSVTTKPASALTTIPTPRRRRMSASSSSCPAMIRSVSKLCTVRNRTVHRLPSRAVTTPLCFAFLAFLDGGSLTASSACGASLLSSSAQPAAASGRGVHARVERTSVQARCGHQWRCIFTTTSRLRRVPFEALGIIHVTPKYSLSPICCSASSKADSSRHGAPFTARITASDFTLSPKTKPACAT
mmetsp:Transcript_61747/g.159289  ORF Transcript_61747/g.159289 Transcript_61747/m.159289 type:complete len:404 (+) Transcript_61747:400-1611(+)